MQSATSSFDFQKFRKRILDKIIKDKITIKMNTNPYRYRPLYDALTGCIREINLEPTQDP